MTRWMLAAVVALAADSRGGAKPTRPTREGGAVRSAGRRPRSRPGARSRSRSGRSTSIPARTGTVAEFEKETGIGVKYVEEINDNDQFFGKIRPQLERGDSGDRS